MTNSKHNKWSDRIIWIIIGGALLFVGKSIATKAYVNSYAKSIVLPVKIRVYELEKNFKAIKKDTCYITRMVAKLVNDRQPDCIEN